MKKTRLKNTNFTKLKATGQPWKQKQRSNISKVLRRKPHKYSKNQRRSNKIRAILYEFLKHMVQFQWLDKNIFH